MLDEVSTYPVEHTEQVVVDPQVAQFAIVQIAVQLVEEAKLNPAAQVWQVVAEAHRMQFVTVVAHSGEQTLLARVKKV